MAGLGTHGRRVRRSCDSARTYEALARAVEGAPATEPEDQLLQVIIEAKQLAFVLRRLEIELTPRLELRARLIREGLEAGLEQALHGLLEPGGR